MTSSLYNICPRDLIVNSSTKYGELLLRCLSIKHIRNRHQSYGNVIEAVTTYALNNAIRANTLLLVPQTVTYSIEFHKYAHKLYGFNPIVQVHFHTCWTGLEKYQCPVGLFVRCRKVFPSEIMYTCEFELQINLESFRGRSPTFVWRRTVLESATVKLLSLPWQNELGYWCRC